VPTRDQQLANTPLTGEELKKVVLAKAETLLKEIHDDVIDRLTAAMERTGQFTAHYSHPRARMIFSVKFQWGNVNMPKVEISTMAGEGVPAPLDVDSQIIIRTEQTHSIENPNLERLDAGIPFMRTDVQKAKPGEVFAKVTEVEIPVDPGDYANVPRTPAEIADTSAELATALKVSKDKHLPKRR